MTGNLREHGYASIQGYGGEKRDLLGSAIVGLWVAWEAPEGGGGSQSDGNSRQQMRIQADLNPDVGQVYSSICLCKGAVEVILLVGQSLLIFLSALQAQP